MVSFNEKVIMTGGYGSDESSEGMFRFDTVAQFSDDVWELKGKLNHPRDGHNAINIGGNTIIVGGNGNLKAEIWNGSNSTDIDSELYKYQYYPALFRVHPDFCNNNTNK